MFEHAYWIWPTEVFGKNQRADFFFCASLTEIPTAASAFIATETKYWLFVNGRPVVMDGELFRESTPGNGYFDRVDLAPHLRLGENEIAVHVWYFGGGGRNNSFCEKPGLLLSCPALSLVSDGSTPCRLDDAYYTPAEEKPSYLYGGDNTAYDARIRPFSLCPTFADTTPAVILGGYGDAPWGTPEERPVPLLYFSPRIRCFSADKPKNKKIIRQIPGQYICSLPHAAHVSPYIRLRAKGGEKIDIRSDRYEVHGGPGDTKNVYRGHRAEYVCREGEQEFEMLDWIFGEKLFFTVPDGAEVLELGYRISGYPADAPVTAFTCNDPALNRLYGKCVRTLQVCMRENFMDCPDRERGQWIGDVSVQAPQVTRILDANAMLLLKKAIRDFIRLRKGDRLVGNVPGDNFSELPSQSLNAIGEWGMIASYYRATGDREILALAFEPAVRYLRLWETDGDGVVLPRRGNWEWYDHLFNIDKPILNVCWYASALRFARTMGEILDDHRFDEFLKERLDAIGRTFEGRYWHEREGYYASGDFADDRANAMAVLAGLCSPDKYPAVRCVLTSVFNSTPYMEYYVLAALCEMGYKADAIARMKCRYQPLIENENSTLWEDFFQLGTRNHAWSGGPAAILLQYFAGLQEDRSTAETDIAPLTGLRCHYVNREGMHDCIVK